MGDTLLVTFANKADKVYSILPHGVIYDKASDAAPNVDGESWSAPWEDPGPFTCQSCELEQLFQLFEPYSSSLSSAENDAHLTGLWEGIDGLPWWLRQ